MTIKQSENLIENLLEDNKMESIIFIEQLSDQFFMMFLTEKYIPIKNILKCFNQIVNM